MLRMVIKPPLYIRRNSMKMGYVTLYVEDIPAAVDFYRKVLDLELHFMHESGHYAEMKTGETVLAFSHHKLAESLVPQGYQKATHSEPLGMQLGFEVKNVQEIYEKALAYGARDITPPEIKPWGFESAMVQDCSGHLIEFCRELPPVNPS